MKRTVEVSLFVFICIVSLHAQYRVLWNFAGAPGDGSLPLGGLVFDRHGNLYGTTYMGGSSAACSPNGCGTIFELSPNADGNWTETVLYSFCSDPSNIGCLDGAFPSAGLVFDNAGNLYGTTSIGGSAGKCGFGLGGCGAGTVFKLAPPSAPGKTWTESVLYSFCTNYNAGCLDGAVPLSQLAIDSAGNLYGTTTTGGLGGTDGGGCCLGGTVFELSPARGSWQQTVLYNFCANGQNGVCPDGAAPQAGVTLDSSGNLYGTTEAGGVPKSQGKGAVYKLSHGSNGWTEKVLLAPRYPFGNGGAPVGGVGFDSLGNLYSTFSEGGPGGAGGVFKLSVGQSTSVFPFNGQNGDVPTAGVLVDSKRNRLYGTTSGGSSSAGTVFQISAPSQLTVLYSFCSQQNCTDGLYPLAGVIADKSRNLYGTTKEGGANGFGVVFEVSPQGELPLATNSGTLRSLLRQKH